MSDTWLLDELERVGGRGEAWFVVERGLNRVSLKQDFKELEKYQHREIKVRGSGMTAREALINAFGHGDADH